MTGALHRLRDLWEAAVSRKPCPERGDAAELVPLTLHGISDRFDSAAGLCYEEQQFTTEKGVPAIQTQHFSDVERFVCFHTHTLSRSFFILLPLCSSY